MDENKKNTELMEETLPTENAEEQASTVMPEEVTESAVQETVEEKDSTTELREAYEEAVAAGVESKEEGMKKRKKFTKKKIVLLSVGGFLLLVIIAVGLFFLIGALTWKAPQPPKELKAENTMPTFESTYTEAQVDMIDDAVKLASSGKALSEADQQKIKEAIAEMYRTANENKINCDQALAVLRGEGKATLTFEFGGSEITPSGGMIVRGIKVQGGEEFYYHKAAAVNDCSVPNGMVFDIVSGKLNQQERAYTNGKTDSRLTGTLKDPDMKIRLTDGEVELDTVPFINGTVKKITKYGDDYTTFKKNGYYLEDPREITNFKIKAEYIVLGDLEEGQSYIELAKDEKGDKFYICRFSLDYTNEDCVKIARQYLRDSAQKDVPQNEQDLQYAQFDVTMEVWENGYLKRMYDEEMWKGTVEGTKTSSTSKYESVIFYDYSDKLFSEEDQALYEGEDWAKKIIARYKEELDQVQ